MKNLSSCGKNRPREGRFLFDDDSLWYYESNSEKLEFDILYDLLYHISMEKNPMEKFQNSNPVSPDKNNPAPHPENVAAEKPWVETVPEKYQQWNDLFKKVVFEKKFFQKISGDEDLALSRINTFVRALEKDQDQGKIHLDDYSLFINDNENGTLVTKQGTIAVSFLDIEKDGPNEVARIVLSKIEKEKRNENSSEKPESSPEKLEDAVAQEVPREQEQKKEGAPEQSRGEFENDYLPPEREDGTGGVEPEGGSEEEHKPESVADGELPPGTFGDGAVEEESGAVSESEPVGSDAQKESPRPRSRQERSFDHLFGEDRPDWKRNVREAASRIAERFVPKNTIDWAKIAYASELGDWHTGRAVRLKEKWATQQDAIRNLETGSRYLADQEKKFREQGEVGAATLLRIERERADQEAKLTKAQNAADRTQSSLEHRNEQRQRFLNKRNEICRNFQVRVEERIRPFEERLSDLKLTRERLENEIVQDKVFIISRQAAAEATLKKIAEEKFPSVRRAYRERMAPVLRDIASFSREIAEREKDKARIDKGIMKQNKKLRPFEDRHEKLARIMRDQGVDTGVPERDRTRHHAAEVSQTEGSAHGAGAPESSAAEAQETYSGKDLVDAWNNANGSRMLIHPETAKENFPTFFASGASVDDFWRFAEFYAERYGDEDQLAGMPSMERAARRRKGFWKKLFGRSNRQKNQGRFKEYLKKLK